MRCYVNDHPCTCDLDDISKDGCKHDGIFIDPFRAGEPDEFVEYLNGGPVENRILG
jgi:hypothetical protein